ncbi:MAG: DegV family protein [Eubacteriales bacterium]
MKVKVITDSISDISKEAADSYNIEVLPISVSLDGEFIPDDKIKVTETIEWIEKNKKRPLFKGVSTEAYEKAFGEYISQGYDIICITAGSKSISNYDCACHASTMYPNSNIHVIDSHQLSTGQGLMALKAAAMAKNDESANGIAIRFERNIDKIKQYGLADSVDYLQYAGLCPKIVAVGSNWLNAKYLVELLKDKKFDVQMVGNSMNKAVPAYCNNIFKDLRNIDPRRVFIMHTKSEEDYFAEVYRRVLALEYFEDIIVCNAGSYSTSLVGKSGISISYQLK